MGTTCTERSTGGAAEAAPSARQRLQEVAAVASEALGDPDAWNGLVTFLERSLHMQFGDRGRNQMMNDPELGDERVNDARDRIAPLMTALVQRAQQQGALRGDFDQTDLLFMQVAAPWPAPIVLADQAEVVSAKTRGQAVPEARLDR